MLDLTGMQTIEQLVSIMEVEIESLTDTDTIFAVAYQ